MTSLKLPSAPPLFQYWFAIFLNTLSNQSEDNYFLQIQPNRRPDLSSMVEPGRQHCPLHPLSVNKILEQKRPS